MEYNVKEKGRKLLKLQNRNIMDVGGKFMSFKKAFIIGYIVFLTALAFIYFLAPQEYSWIAIVILSLLFGIYQVIVQYRLKQRQS